MKSINIIFVLLIILGIFSCSKNNSSQNEEGPELFPQPKSHSLKLDDGYLINPLTGDSIKPIINSVGDTVKTGVKIIIEGKQIHPDSFSKPKVINAGKGKIVIAHPNRHKIPDDLNVIPINESELKKSIIQNIGMKDTSHYIKNSIGKKVKTGVKIPVKGKSISSFDQPKIVQGLPFQMKENAVYDIQNIDVDQGLNSSYINTIYEDRKNNIWFVSYGGGVSKYDGNTFSHFTEKNGLSSKYVFTILEDSKGNFWFGTADKGVCMYDGEKFIYFSEEEGLSNNSIWSIIEDRKGNIWFCTYGGGICKYNGQSFIHFTMKEGLSSDLICVAEEDVNGNIWFGTDGGGVMKYDGKSFVHFTEKDGLSNNNVWAILEDRKGNLWFGTYGGGVSKFNGESFVNYTVNEGMSNNYVMSAVEDKNGDLWFGTYYGGINKFDGEYFHHINESEGLSKGIVKSILVDVSGNLWLGTNGGGVSKLDPSSFTLITEKEGLSNSYVWSILEDRKGNYWFSTYGGGINKYDGKMFVQYAENEGMNDEYILTSLEDRNGNIWFGSFSGGVTKFDGENFTQFTVNEGLSNNNVWSILEDKKGNLWFGTYGGGVSKFDGNSFTHFTEAEGFCSNIVLSIKEDSRGNIWFGTEGGVSKYDGKYFINYTEKEGMSSNFIYSIHEDKNGNMWFGSNFQGLMKFDGNRVDAIEEGKKYDHNSLSDLKKVNGKYIKSFTYFTASEGLNSNAVWSIIEDKNENLWLGAEMGLNRIEINSGKIKNNKESAKEFRMDIILKQDGLKGLDIYHNSDYIDSKNQIWWGTNKGIEVLDLNKFHFSTKIPEAHLNQIYVNEIYLDYRNLPDSLKNEIIFDKVNRFENYPMNLELPYTLNHLTFHFSAIDWAAPHKIKYQYKLEGLDESWNPVTDKTFADYRNIPYGHYIFMVRSMGESQEWSKPFEYSFTIHPPWWHTTWFRIFYISVIVILLYLLYRWRTKSLRDRQKQLEQTVDERTRELKHEKQIVEEKHREITDSINYAERIQRSFLATKDLLDENLKDYFVFFQPKDIVSGDFYWATKLSNGNFALVTADSTGHGVPGAIMSILNITCLEKAVEEEKLTEPSEILNHARKNIIERLKKDGSPEGGKDGMDASLVCLDMNHNKLNFAAANNPIWIVRKNEILEFSPDKMPVGKHDKQNIPFNSTQVELESGDIIYTLTDGFPDQFGGEKGKKFMYKKLKELLLSISKESMEIQREKLKSVFLNWRGNLEQVDDVCIIGIRI